MDVEILLAYFHPMNLTLAFNFIAFLACLSFMISFSVSTDGEADGEKDRSRPVTIIASSVGVALLLLISILVVIAFIVCVKKRRKQQQFTIAPDPIYEVPLSIKQTHKQEQFSNSLDSHVYAVPVLPEREHNHYQNSYMMGQQESFSHGMKKNTGQQGFSYEMSTNVSYAPTAISQRQRSAAV